MLPVAAVAQNIAPVFEMQPSAERNYCFETPTVLKSEILQFLDGQSLARVCSVNKTGKKLAEHEPLWRRRFLKGDFPVSFGLDMDPKSERALKANDPTWKAAFARWWIKVRVEKRQLLEQTRQRVERAVRKRRADARHFAFWLTGLVAGVYLAQLPEAQYVNLITLGIDSWSSLG